MKLVTVRQLVEEFEFRVIAGKRGLEKEITDYSLKRPSAELVGYLTYLTPQRIQIYGRTELGLFEELSPHLRYDNLAKVMIGEVPCLIVTRGLPIPPEFIQLAEERDIPLLASDRSTTQLYYLLIRFLANRLAPSTLVHGVLVDVFGVGVLITGDSGIGKSETALELIRGGHLLVADDAVEVQRVDEENLHGRAPQSIRHLLEVRGLGILDVTKLFGAGSVREEKEINLLVELEEWEEGKYYDRLGLDPPQTSTILGIPVPKVTIPVRPGRHLASIIEVAVMQNRLRSRRK
ncbi:Hpr(Ser) kinase/phosphatase [Desulfosporosinus acidiphilus SJ4]|uniref:HPr kinase/phosphorylase n=1 Tax=Desulfosporosinus acidiphilus (strain DSM 22704 / JCM 16185 / SJ4) TaxID=646529 RepID=I4D2I2_DESAJ|nr:Hpr(Ser) kinase/phosphatase [Desulfosporosinus acidiphilus SJ4]